MHCFKPDSILQDTSINLLKLIQLRCMISINETSNTSFGYVAYLLK